MSLWQPSDHLNHILDILAVVLVCIAAVPATLFPLVYLARPWRSSWVGRALMTLSVGFLLLIDISILYNLFGDDYPYRNLVRALVYLTIAIGLWMQFLSLVFARWDRDLSDEHEGETVE